MAANFDDPFSPEENENSPVLESSEDGPFIGKRNKLKKSISSDICRNILWNLDSYTSPWSKDDFDDGSKAVLLQSTPSFSRKCRSSASVHQCSSNSKQKDKLNSEHYSTCKSFYDEAPSTTESELPLLPPHPDKPQLSQNKRTKSLLLRQHKKRSSPRLTSVHECNIKDNSCTCVVSLCNSVPPTITHLNDSPSVELGISHSASMSEKHLVNRNSLSKIYSGGKKFQSQFFNWRSQSFDVFRPGALRGRAEEVKKEKPTSFRNFSLKEKKHLNHSTVSTLSCIH